MVLTTVRANAIALLRRSARAAGNRQVVASVSALPAPTHVRAFSGNREYPRIEETVAELASKMNHIGPMLSIPTAAIYFSRQKLEYLVRHMKGKDELKQVHQVLLLADAKLVYPSTYTIGTFLSACLKQEMADLALDFVRKADNMRHYMPPQSLVRVMAHFAAQGNDAVVQEITARMQELGIKPSYKVYNFWIAEAKKQNDLDRAVVLAKEAADAHAINSHTILTLLDNLEGDALEQQIPLAKYLVSKGDVFVNEKLSSILASN